MLLTKNGNKTLISVTLLDSAWRTNLTLQTKPLREGEKRTLQALKDGKLQTFNNLKTNTGLSGTSLSDNLKLLQKKELIERDIDSRKYGITRKGNELVKKNDVTETINAGLLIEERSSSPPVDSIVAIDIPNLQEAQKRVLMNGTVNIAQACFDQFLEDLSKAKSPKNYNGGRILYTSAIDFDEAQSWLKSDDGKAYKKSFDKKRAAIR